MVASHRARALPATTGRIIGAAFLTMAGLTPLAEAGISDVILEIRADSGSLSGGYGVSLDMGSYDAEAGRFLWHGTNIELTSAVDSQTVATLLEMEVFIDEDPQVNLSFAVQAGAQDTQFTITSGLVSFPAIDSAEAVASAGLSLTDANGDGALLTGMGAAGGAYTAQYNGLVPSGTTFLEAMDELVADAGRSASDSVVAPGAGGFATLAGPVSDISSSFAFSLSAFDMASGTSTFVVLPAAEVVPVPQALGLGLAGMIGVLARRRRCTRRSC
jgi:hypothetical protein